MIMKTIAKIKPGSLNFEWDRKGSDFSGFLEGVQHHAVIVLALLEEFLLKR